MKYLFYLICCGLIVGCTANPTATTTAATDAETMTNLKIENKIVAASCGQCNFGMSKKGCDLAVRIDNKAYYVDGAHIDTHGDVDPHAAHGFCEQIRQAKVSGEIVNNRFQVANFELLPLAK